MSIWYYCNKQGERISITGGQLKWLTKNGEITPETLIETEGGKTVPAKKISGLTFNTNESIEPNPEGASFVEKYTSTAFIPTHPQSTFTLSCNNQKRGSIPVPLPSPSQNSSDCTFSNTHSSETNDLTLFILGGVSAALVLCVVSVIVWACFGNNSKTVAQASQVVVQESQTGTPETEPDKEQDDVPQTPNPIVATNLNATNPTTKTTEQIVEQCEKSIALIKGRIGSGTGFLIDSNIVATNRHVIEDDFLEYTEIIFPSAPESEKGPYESKLLYIDPKLDLAFLQVQTPLPKMSIAANHLFKRGQDIVIIGNPGGLENAVNIGVLSSQKNIEGLTFYQLGISLNPGNSGGPVINRNSEVIGVATLKSTMQEGIAFCIPINEVLVALSGMKKLSEKEKEQQNSLHRARTAFSMLSIVHKNCQGAMKVYDYAMEKAIEKGYTARDAIDALSKQIDEHMDEVEHLFLEDTKAELSKIKRDSNLPDSIREGLGKCYANCLKIKSYVDNPRGTTDTYREKMNELVEEGEQLQQELLIDFQSFHQYISPL